MNISNHRLQPEMYKEFQWKIVVVDLYKNLVLMVNLVIKDIETASNRVLDPEHIGVDL